VTYLITSPNSTVKYSASLADNSAFMEESEQFAMNDININDSINDIDVNKLENKLNLNDTSNDNYSFGQLADMSHIIYV
jgi:hypothetical protein